MGVSHSPDMRCLQNGVHYIAMPTANTFSPIFRALYVYVVGYNSSFQTVHGQLMLTCRELQAGTGISHIAQHSTQ